MKNFQGRHIILFSLALWMATVTLPARVQADDANASYTIELINQIRQDPLTYAESLGYGREAVVAGLPWLETELSGGLPALEYSEFLAQYAAVENAGTTLVGNTGYTTAYARTGTLSGMVSFNNFMSASVAVQIIVNDQFVQELSPGYSGQRCILSKELDLAGAAFDATTINGINAYVLTVSLGSTTLKTDRQILNQINQLRSNPVGIGSILNLDLSGYSGYYPPLFRNDQLDEFCATPFVSDPNFRVHLENFGYLGFGVGKITALGDFPKTDLNTVAFWMFSSLVVNEIKGLGDGGSILGSYLNDIGMNLVYLSDDVWDRVSMTVVAGLSVDPVPEKAKIYGLVYLDGDGNDVYTPGEGRAQRTVQIYRQDTQVLVSMAVTDNAGYFEAELDMGQSYTVSIGTGDTLTWSPVVMNGDQFVKIKVAD